MKNEKQKKKLQKCKKKSFTCVFFQLETRNYFNNNNNNKTEIYTLLTGKLLTHVIPQTSIFLMFFVVIRANNRNPIPDYNNYEYDELKDIKT